MLSRAGKSTTNQYLAFQKIEGGGASAKFNAVRQANDSSADAGSQMHGFLPKDKSLPSEVGKKKMRNTQDDINQQLRAKIQAEMEKIQRQSHFDKLPLGKKIMRSQMQQAHKVDPKLIEDEIQRIQRQACDASFKCQPRDIRIKAFASKTNSPAVGKYTPRFTQVENTLAKNVSYVPEPDNLGFLRKQELNHSKMTICPHTIRVIEDWAGRKVQNSTKNVGRG